MNFPNAGVEIIEVPTNAELYRKKMAAAKTDAAAAYDAAVWALKRGLLADFHRGVDRTLELDPKHPAALSVKKLKAEIEKPLAESTREEAELRALVKKEGMKIATSKHFILLHDTPDKLPTVKGNAQPGRRVKRSTLRLELLEQVYESFLMLFYAQDVTLDIPRERLKVVLFNDFSDFDTFSQQLSPELTSVAGYWDPVRNVSVFYDHGTDENFKVLKELSDNLQKQAELARRNPSPEGKNLLRFSNTLQLLVQIAQENADIEVVSHEATHQLAGNTGLFPRHVRIPSWAHEGLATYFESPGESGWSGIGAVNEQRLEWYQGLEPDRVHSNIDFIVGDQIFTFARTHGSKLHGYGQAWALTHFLLEKHLPKAVEFYRRLGELPPDVVLDPELLTTLFDQVFATDHEALDREWRLHMKGLMPDFERAKAEAKKLKE